MPDARVIVRTRNETEREMILSGGASVGRATDNTICVSEAGISRYHALIEERTDGWWLSDLDSANGTWVNGEKLKSERRLSDGDAISFGGISALEFFCDADQAAVADSNANSSQPVGQEPHPAEQKKGSFAAKFAGAVVGLAIVALFVAIFAGGYLPISGWGTATPAPTRTFEPPSTPPSPTVTETVPTDQIAVKSSILAGIVGGSSDYVFDPALIERIRQWLPQYQNPRLPERISCQEMTDAFYRTGGDGNTPQLGFVVALSESRFLENPAGTAPLVGYWKVPRAQVTGALPAALSPKLAAEIGAGYLKKLLAVTGRNDFMYAIACYGYSLDKVADVRSRLDQLDPSGQARRDFWTMWPRVVPPGMDAREGADRVARFFAAGIAGQQAINEATR